MFLVYTDPLLMIYSHHQYQAILSFLRISKELIKYGRLESLLCVASEPKADS